MLVVEHIPSYFCASVGLRTPFHDPFFFTKLCVTFNSSIPYNRTELKKQDASFPVLRCATVELFASSSPIKQPVLGGDVAS